MFNNKVVLVLCLLIISSVIFADAPKPADCSTCEDTSNYSSSTAFASVDKDHQVADFTLSYENKTKNPPFQPVSNAVVIVRVYNDTWEGELYKIYTDQDGLARFNFSTNPVLTQGCHRFDFVYCHTQIGCGFTNCLTLANVPANLITEVGNIADPAVVYYNPKGASQNPPLVLPTVASAYYCAPPKKTTSVPAFCLPLALIFALLAGAAYITGRNPLMGFDLSSPRLGRYHKYSGRAQGFGFDVNSIAATVAASLQSHTASKGGESTKGEPKQGGKTPSKAGGKGPEVKSQAGTKLEGSSTLKSGPVGPGGTVQTISSGAPPIVRFIRFIAGEAKGEGVGKSVKDIKEQVKAKPTITSWGGVFGQLGADLVRRMNTVGSALSIADSASKLSGGPGLIAERLFGVFNWNVKSALEVVDAYKNGKAVFKLDKDVIIDGVAYKKGTEVSCKASDTGIEGAGLKFVAVIGGKEISLDKLGSDYSAKLLNVAMSDLAKASSTISTLGREQLDNKMRALASEANDKGVFTDAYETKKAELAKLEEERDGLKAKAVKSEADQARIVALDKNIENMSDRISSIYAVAASGVRAELVGSAITRYDIAAARFEVLKAESLEATGTPGLTDKNGLSDKLHAVTQFSGMLSVNDRLLPALSKSLELSNGFLGEVKASDAEIKALRSVVSGGFSSLDFYQKANNETEKFASPNLSKSDQLNSSQIIEGNLRFASLYALSSQTATASLESGCARYIADPKFSSEMAAANLFKAGKSQEAMELLKTQYEHAVIWLESSKLKSDTDSYKQEFAIAVNRVFDANSSVIGDAKLTKAAAEKGEIFLKTMDLYANQGGLGPGNMPRINQVNYFGLLEDMKFANSSELSKTRREQFSNHVDTLVHDMYVEHSIQNGLNGLKANAVQSASSPQITAFILANQVRINQDPELKNIVEAFTKASEEKGPKAEIAKTALAEILARKFEAPEIGIAFMSDKFNPNKMTEFELRANLMFPKLSFAPTEALDKKQEEIFHNITQATLLGFVDAKDVLDFARKNGFAKEADTLAKASDNVEKAAFATKAAFASVSIDPKNFEAAKAYQEQTLKKEEAAKNDLINKIATGVKDETVDKAFNIPDPSRVYSADRLQETAVLLSGREMLLNFTSTDKQILTAQRALTDAISDSEKAAADYEQKAREARESKKGETAEVRKELEKLEKVKEKALEDYDVKLHVLATAIANKGDDAAVNDHFKTDSVSSSIVSVIASAYSHGSSDLEPKIRDYFDTSTSRKEKEQLFDVISKQLAAKGDESMQLVVAVRNAHTPEEARALLGTYEQQIRSFAADAALASFATPIISDQIRVLGYELKIKDTKTVYDGFASQLLDLQQLNKDSPPSDPVQIQQRVELESAIRSSAVAYQSELASSYLSYSVDLKRATGIDTIGYQGEIERQLVATRADLTKAHESRIEFLESALKTPIATEKPKPDASVEGAVNDFNATQFRLQNQASLFTAYHDYLEFARREDIYDKESKVLDSFKSTYKDFFTKRDSLLDKREALEDKVATLSREMETSRKAAIGPSEYRDDMLTMKEAELNKAKEELDLVKRSLTDTNFTKIRDTLEQVFDVDLNLIARRRAVSSDKRGRRGPE